MAKAYMIMPILGEQTELEGVAYRGHSAAWIGDKHGGYIVTGTVAQLAALAALPSVYVICTMAEIDQVVALERRLRLNTWLAQQGWPNIPTNWTYRSIVEAIYRRANARYTSSALDVADA